MKRFLTFGIVGLLLYSCGGGGGGGGLAPLLQLLQTALNFPSSVNSLQLQIKNNGGGTLTWNLTESLDWLTLDQTSGSTAAGQTSTVNVTVNRTGQNPGSYTGTISVTSNGGNGTVNATLVVIFPSQDDVDSAPNGAGWVNLITDINGTDLHLGYYNASNGPRYIKRTGGVWGLPIVVETNPAYQSPQVGKYLSMALSADGKPSMAYQDGTGVISPGKKFFVYAYSQGTTWTTLHSSFGATGDDLGNYCGLARSKASGETDDFALHASLPSNTLYAVHCSESTCSPVPLGDPAGIYPSIYASGGRNNAIYLSLIDPSNNSLGFLSCENMTCSPTAPTLLTILTGLPAGSAYTSLASSDGTSFRIAYYAGSDGLKVIACDSNCTTPANWNLSWTVEAGANNGRYPHLIYVPGDTYHIAYVDASHQVKHAWWDNTTASWKTEIVADNIGTNGGYPSVALTGGTDNKIYIAYYNDTTKKIVLASKPR